MTEDLIELTKQRIKRLVELGVVQEGAAIPPPSAGLMTAEWKDMCSEERAKSARAIEVYAAMVEELDENIGRVIDYLKSTGELDNTFVLFMSDNGAEGAAMGALPVMGGPRTMANIIEKYYDNSLENMGSKDSFVWYGPRWACAGTAPNRGVKGWTTEGGIRCPCILRYPPLRPKAGSISHAFTTVMDILPTILELAGLKHPGETYRGRQVALPHRKSWVPHLSSPTANSTVHGKETHVHGWELFGQRAIRQGKWKAVWLTYSTHKDGWELYDIEEDPGEMNDLADVQPEILDRLVEFWGQYVSETGMIPTPMFAKKAVASK